MIYLRSFVFNAVFYIAMVCYMLAMVVAMVLPRQVSVFLLHSFSRLQDFLLRILTGTRVEIRGLEKIPEGPVIVACKHQSTWETFSVLRIVDDPAIVMKRELGWIPVFGWLAYRCKMIMVHRGKKGAAIKSLVKGAKTVVADGRQVIIFPEGTRRPPGAPPQYKAGTHALYAELDVPCVPVALNSGLYWPRRKFVRYPGTIVMEILDPIMPGLGRTAFNNALRGGIEGASNRLIEEAAERDGRTPEGVNHVA